MEAEHAGLMFGMEAIMADAAYDEDTTVEIDGTEVPCIGSLVLLSNAEVGTRVHYEGKVEYSDPNPREVGSNDASGSPRKRPVRYGTAAEANTVCDVILKDNTGPVLITLWGDLVHTWYATMGNPAAPYVRPHKSASFRALADAVERYVSLANEDSALRTAICNSRRIGTNEARGTYLPVSDTVYLRPIRKHLLALRSSSRSSPSSEPRFALHCAGRLTTSPRCS